MRIQRIFEADDKLKGLEPNVRKRLRDERVRPYVEDFFEWARPEHQKMKGTRGPLASALGYSINQEDALKRFLDDGRLSLDNNSSERALRTIATGRNAWLFVGSDDSAQSAGSFFSLIASCKLHRLEPEAYLRDVRTRSTITVAAVDGRGATQPRWQHERPGNPEYVNGSAAA